MKLGHGHIIPRSDGFKAQCGGPSLCEQCAGELFDHTQRMEKLAALYQYAFDRMRERYPDVPELAHRSGLMSVYLCGLKESANVKSEP